MNPATITQVGDWWLVWTSTIPFQPHGPTFSVCLGSFQVEADAIALCTAFNDPNNHLGGAAAPG